jgi:hypothetical protein
LGHILTPSNESAEPIKPEPASRTVASHKFYHDELVPPEDHPKYHEAYRRMSEAVSASLGTFLWAMEQFRSAAYAERRDIHAVPLLLMLDFAEAIDGVAVLARSGSAKNCSQLLRTALEIQLSVRYMMESKGAYEQRVLAYEFYHLAEQLRWEQRADPTSNVGKQFRAELAGDQFVGIFDVKGRDVAGEIRILEAKMNSTRYAIVRTELARMKAEKIRDAGWFSLWNGPKNIREVAIRLKMGSFYDVFYRSWSSVTHGEAAVKRASGIQGDAIQLSPLRSPELLPEMCRHACQQAHSMVLFIIHGLLPHLEAEMKERYIRDVRPGLLFIDSVKGL